MAAPAVPAGAAAAEGVAAIAPALGWLVLACLLFLYRRSLKKVIYGFADLIAVDISVRGAPDIHLFHGLASWLRHQADNIDALIAAGMLACEKATVWLLQQAWQTILWTAREIGDLAVTVEHALWNHRYSIAKALIYPLTAFVKVQLAILRKATAATRDLTETLFGRAHKGIDRIEKIATRTIPKQLGRVTTRVGRLEKTLAGLRGHAGAIERLLGAAAVATLVGAALNRLGLRWLRCGNVKRAGRGVCGMDSGLLEDLLLGVTALTIGLNLRTFADEMGEVVEETAEFITARVT